MRSLNLNADKLTSRRPQVTMFMLQSVDGKIATGPDAWCDFDTDLPALPGVAEGLHRYYELEKETSLWAMCSGKTKDKIFQSEQYNWLNSGAEKLGVNLVLVGSTKPGKDCVRFLCDKYHQVILFSPNPRAELESLGMSNLHIECLGYYVDSSKYMIKILETLYAKYACDDLTLQGGATLNASMLAAGCVDKMRLVVAPLLVGGCTTPTLVDGKEPMLAYAGSRFPVLTLTKVKTLGNSYLCLDYEVRRDV